MFNKIGKFTLIFIKMYQIHLNIYFKCFLSIGNPVPTGVFKVYTASRLRLKAFFSL